MTKKEVTQLSYDIVGCAITVHKILGPGLLENDYEKCLKEELEFLGFNVETQQKALKPLVNQFFKNLNET